jgi:hypothetical protein
MDTSPTDGNGEVIGTHICRNYKKNPLRVSILLGGFCFVRLALADVGADSPANFLVETFQDFLEDRLVDDTSEANHSHQDRDQRTHEGEARADDTQQVSIERGEGRENNRDKRHR